MAFVAVGCRGAVEVEPREDRFVELIFGEEEIDLSAVKQIADTAQGAGTVLALAYAVQKKLLDGKNTLF